MNSRCKTADGTIHFILDKTHTKYLQKDFEGVTTHDGTAGEIDKKSEKALTHLTDAFGYMIHAEHPIGSAGVDIF